MRALLLVASLLLAVSAVAQAASPADYAGVYVGVAEDRPAKDGITERRDLEVTIRPTDDGGFVVEWTNVTLVDGRRDLPGVRRIRGRAQFAHKHDSLYVETRGYDPFRQDEEVLPMRGDAIRWAVLDDTGLTMLSFGVMEDGSYEIQQTRRTRTKDGLDIEYTRIADGVLRRHMVGRAVAVADGSSP